MTGTVIVVRYLGPTDHRGARLVATSAAFDGRLTVDRRYEMDFEQQAVAVAQEAATRYGIRAKASAWGYLPDGSLAVFLRHG